jgi:hypothetical protein
MRSLHREVKIYRVDNERIMKAQEKILQSLNILQRKSTRIHSQSKQLMLEKYQHQGPMEKGMIMEMIGSQEVGAGAIILQGIPLEEIMQDQGQGVSQVCLLFGGK